MNARISKLHTSLPQSGEQVMIRPRGTERDFTVLGTISKLTTSSIECVIDKGQLEQYLPDLARKRTGLASLLKTSEKVDIEVTYAREIGGVYRFTTRVVARLGENATKLQMELPATVRKSQRRRDYRLPLAAKVTIGSESPGVKVEGSMVNLSATGAKIISSQSFRPGQRLELTIDAVESSKAIDSIQAVVIECLTAPDTQNESKISYTLRLGFDDEPRVKLPVWQQEEIAHYIFEQQRQMLRLRNIIGGD